jgi:hypothetical protein
MALKIFYHYWAISIKLSLLYQKAVRIAVRPDGISSQEAEEKRENTLFKFLTARIGIIIIASLMVLEEFELKLPYFGSCRNSWFGLWF